MPVLLVACSSIDM